MFFIKIKCDICATISSFNLTSQIIYTWYKHFLVKTLFLRRVSETKSYCVQKQKRSSNVYMHATRTLYLMWHSVTVLYSKEAVERCKSWVPSFLRNPMQFTMATMFSCMNQIYISGSFPQRRIIEKYRVSLHLW